MFCRMNHKGSILIEALAAVAIMSVSLTMIMQSLMGAYRSGISSQEYAKAIYVLESQLALLSVEKEKSAIKPKIEDVDPLLKNLKKNTLSVPIGASTSKKLTLTTFIAGEDVTQTSTSTFYN